MGSGSVLCCEKCGYELSVRHGVGMLYPKEQEKLLQDIMSGKKERRFRNLANSAKNPRIEFSHELYGCKNCGHVSQNMDIELYDGDELLLKKEHKCRKCKSIMEIKDNEDDIKCPKCNTILMPTALIMWD